MDLGSVGRSRVRLHRRCGVALHCSS